MQSSDVKQYYVYVMLSRTHSRFGHAIRRVTGDTYSHASIAFDKDFKYLFGMGRFVNSVPVVAGLVREYPERFTLKRENYVEVIIYRIPVTKQQYMCGARRIREILRDSEGYFYNLYCTLTYPIFHGITSYKAYTCSELVVHLLKLMEVELPTDKEACCYTPEQMQELLAAYPVVHKGNLLDYVHSSIAGRPVFFRRFRCVRDSINTLYILILLACRIRVDFSPMKASMSRFFHRRTRQGHSAK